MHRAVQVCKKSVSYRQLETELFWNPDTFSYILLYFISRIYISVKITIISKVNPNQIRIMNKKYIYMQFPHTTRDVTKNNLWDLYPSLSIYKRSVSVLFVFFDRHFSFLYVAMSLVQLRVVELTADVLIRMLILMLLAMVILKITSALRRVLVISFVIACEALSELRSPGYASEISMDIV